MARIQKVYKEVVIVLKKAQEEKKQQVDKRQKEVEKWNKRDKMILSIKNLVFKERLARKLTELLWQPLDTQSNNYTSK